MVCLKLSVKAESITPVASECLKQGINTLTAWTPLFCTTYSKPNLNHVKRVLVSQLVFPCASKCSNITQGLGLLLQTRSTHFSHIEPDTAHLMQRPCYQRRSTCQDPAGNWTTRRPDHREETQTAVVWSCLPFIRSGQNHLARYSEGVKKTRQTEKRCEDNIREWTGLEFTKTHRAVENRDKWRKLVVK